MGNLQNEKNIVDDIYREDYKKFGIIRGEKRK